MDDTCDVGEDKFFVFLNESNGGPNDDIGNVTDETAQYYCPSWNPPGDMLVSCDIPGGIPGDADENDIEPVMTSNPSHNWIWVDLSPNDLANPACANSNCLKDEVEGVKSYSVSTHTWVYGGSGGHTTVYDSIHDYRIDPGDYVVVPLFDDRCMGNPETPSADCADNVHPGLDDYYVPAGVNSNDVFFHLSAFAIFKVTCVDAANNKQCAARNAMFDKDLGYKKGGPPKVKSFEGCFVGGFVPGLSGQSSQPYETGAFTVYLHR
jgi:hypothetical protein